MRIPLRRLVLLALIAAGLAPGTWLRSPAPDHTALQGLSVTQLQLGEQSLSSGKVRLDAAWELSSKNQHFGGYSALLLLDNGRMFAASDRGRVLNFAMPGLASPQPAKMERFLPEEAVAKHLADIEALTRDPDTGALWAAYEGSNAILRLDPTSGEQIRVFPETMQDWSSNAGPEAMVRMADGRFIVVSEALGGMIGRDSPAVMFSGDPTRPAREVKVTKFSFQAPDGYRATDMAALPDGRMLILVRKVELGFPPGFASKIVLADPAEIEANAVWRGTVIATLDDIAPSENYEAIAVEGGALAGNGGSASPVTIWVMSDDNISSFQRTLLLKLNYAPPAAKKRPNARQDSGRDSEHEKTRENTARPSNHSE